MIVVDRHFVNILTRNSDEIDAGEQDQDRIGKNVRQ